MEEVTPDRLSLEQIDEQMNNHLAEILSDPNFKPGPAKLYKSEPIVQDCTDGMPTLSEEGKVNRVGVKRRKR